MNGDEQPGAEQPGAGQPGAGQPGAGGERSPWASPSGGAQADGGDHPGAPPVDPWSPSTGGSAPGAPAEPYPYAQAPARAGRGRAFVGLAVGAVLAVAATAFAVTSSGSQAPSSPEAAVEALFAAVEDQDVLGVLDALAPAERELYQPFVVDAVSELSRLGVLAGDLDLGSIRGFEIEVDGLTLASTQLGEGVHAVRITGGTISGTVDPAEVPVGDFLRQLMDEPDSGIDGVETASADLAEEPVDLVVIDDDGWHVSLHHSIAEAARKAAGAPVPDFGAGIEPDGAESPEAAVRGAVQAGVDLDVRRAIALLPPGEMRALRDYAPLFLDDVEEAVAELRAEMGVEIVVDDLDLEVDADGDRAEVTLQGFAASGQIDGEPFEVAYDGTCLSYAYEGDDDELCADDEGAAVLGSFRDVRAVLVVVREDGEWYVSPLRTSFDQVLEVLRSLDGSLFDDPDELFGGLTGPLFGLRGSGTAGIEESFGEEGWTEHDDVDPAYPGPAYPDPAYPDAVYPDDVSGDDPYAACEEVYASLPPEATDEDLEELDRAYADCLGSIG